MIARHRIAAIVAAVALAAGGVVLGLRLTRGPAPGPLAGEWRDGTGDLLWLDHITDGVHAPLTAGLTLSPGDDLWTGEIVTNGADTCAAADVTVVGSHGRYQGSYSYYPSSATGFCGSLRAVRLTVTAGPDGTVDIATAAPAGGTCAVCGRQVWTRRPRTAADAADPLTGTWRDAAGEQLAVEPFGGDSWLATFAGGTADDACVPRDIDLAGSGGHYRGTYAFFRNNGARCFPYAGVATISVTIAPGAGTADVTTTAPAHEDCPGCGTRVWTRLSSRTP